MSRHRARTEQLTVETLPGIGRTYEMSDLDGDRVGVVVHRGGGRTLFIWPLGDTEPAAVAALSTQQARRLGLALFDFGSPTDVDVTVPDMSRSDRLLSHAGTPLPPSDPGRVRQIAGSVRGHGSADVRDIDRLPQCPPVGVGLDPDVLAASRLRHPSSIVTSEASAADPRPPVMSSSREDPSCAESDPASPPMCLVVTRRSRGFRDRRH
jgi:hypothetical protein